MFLVLWGHPVYFYNNETKSLRQIFNMNNNSKVLVFFSLPSEYLVIHLYYCYYYYLKLMWLLKLLLDQNLIMIYHKSNKILKMISFLEDKIK
jgi:hypothetical protein